MASNENEATTRPATIRWTAWAIALVGSAAPLIAYWLWLGRLPTLTPPRAKELLRRRAESTLLVDVRSPESFRTRHLAAAVNWPLAQILTVQQPDQLPERYRGRTLLLVCTAGTTSARATRHLLEVGVDDVVNVRGGLQEWTGSASDPPDDVLDRWVVPWGQAAEPPLRESPRYEQWAAIVSGFGFKTTYSVLALLWAVVLWRSKAADLVALRWGMIAFFLGENACAINYLVYNETSYLFEYLHMIGMLVSFGLTSYAVLEGSDRRLLGLSEADRRCAAMPLCRRCVKYADVPCGGKRVFLLVIPALMVIAMMPWCADWHATSYNTRIFASVYNYSHLSYQQAFELLFCPTAALVLLAATLAILVVKRRDPLPLAKVTFAAAMGPLGFGFFRMVLAGVYSQNLVWHNFWEETTELLFIVAVGFVLWTFRRGLFPKAGANEPETSRPNPSPAASP